MPNFVYNHTCDWQIRPPLLSCLIFLITGMIIDQIGFHSLLLPLFIGQLQICGRLRNQGKLTSLLVPKAQFFKISCCEYSCNCILFLESESERVV